MIIASINRENVECKDNNSDNRCSRSGQEMNGKIKQNSWQHKDTRCPEDSPPRYWSYLKEKSI